MKVNDSSKPIRSLQIMLRAAASLYPSVSAPTPDGIYGPKTQAAVSAVQEQHGLPITGTVDQTTWDTVVSDYDSAIVRGSQPEPVCIRFSSELDFQTDDHIPSLALIQCMLTELSRRYHNLPSPEVNGCCSSSTEDCIRSFQHICGLQETGMMCKSTWKNLALQFSMISDQHL